MKNIKFAWPFLLCINFLCYSQVKPSEAKPSENLIIYSTSNKNTSLFFKTPIKSGIVGNPNFTFGYSPKGDSKIGILKATPGEESNLLVITENGNIFSFTIRYKKEIEKSNHFISDDLAIGNETGNIQGTNKNIDYKKEVKTIENSSNVVEAVTVNNYENSKIPDSLSTNTHEGKSKKELGKPLFYNRIYGSKNKVTIKLKNITYQNDELYFTLILKNESTLDYDINYLNFYIISRNKSRNTVAQMIPYEPLYVYNLPSKITYFKEIEVVYVYKKFTINENKTLLVELTENNGERTIKLEIPNTFINNPNK